MGWKRTVAAAAGVTLMVGGLAGCGQDEDEAAVEAADASPDREAVTVADAWTREPAATQTRAAVYATLTNDTDDPVRVVSAASSLTDQVELHETIADDDGAMSMREVSEGFIIPARSQFRFEAGGPHIMLVGIDPASFPSDHVDITLSLDEGAPVMIEAAVEAIAGASGDEHDHEGHDHDHDGDETTPDDHDHEGSAAGAGGDDEASHDHDHDHGHDHGDEGGDDSSDGPPADDPLSVAWLHELDDQLMAGDIEPARQRAVIEPFIAYYEDLDPGADTPEAGLLGLLRDLDDALADDDLARATALATEAHHAAHALEDHEH